MAQILSTITCDLGRGSCTPSSVRVMQYDSDIRYIAVKFLDKGQAWAIPSGFAVKLRMMKSDGTPTCKPVDNVTGNTAQFQLTADMCKNGGSRITITDEDGSHIFEVMDGLDGGEAATPEIGANGNWYIGGVDTGKPSRGEQGPQGEQGAESLDDQTVSTAPEVLPRLRGDGSLIKSGTRICWKGMVKRAAVDLWDTPENAPDAAPTLWEDIQYRQGYRIIPEVITAGLAFALGELGWWGDSLYKSLLNSNVWTPEGYPAGWEKQEE